jgi:hypothetical protein
MSISLAGCQKKLFTTNTFVSLSIPVHIVQTQKHPACTSNSHRIAATAVTQNIGLLKTWVGLHTSIYRLSLAKYFMPLPSSRYSFRPDSLSRSYLSDISGFRECILESLLIKRIELHLMSSTHSCIITQESNNFIYSSSKLWKSPYELNQATVTGHTISNTNRLVTVKENNILSIITSKQTTQDIANHWEAETIGETKKIQLLVTRHILCF